MIENQKLARAIAAMYTATTSEPDGGWTDTDELIQQAAFALYEKVDCYPVEFAQMLIDAGMDRGTAIDFTDISVFDARTLVGG